jgi:transposase-like protein
VPFQVNVKININLEGFFMARQRELTGERKSLMNQLLDTYKPEDAKGMTTRDTTEHLESVYGLEASPVMISKMTNRILPIAKEWQNRPLSRKYAIVFMDAVHYNVRQDNTVIKQAVYIAIGIKLDDTKEVMAIWIGGNESVKYWIGVLNEIRNRGTEDILIASVDGLAGFNDATPAVYPNTEIQRCIVHQIRYPLGLSPTMISSRLWLI